MIGLFCRIASLLQVSFAKDTYNFIDPTNCSHPIVSHSIVSSHQHTATHCNTLQHTATHCNTLQHPSVLMNRWWLIHLITRQFAQPEHAIYLWFFFRGVAVCYSGVAVCCIVLQSNFLRIMLCSTSHTNRISYCVMALKKTPFFYLQFCIKL